MTFIFCFPLIFSIEVILLAEFLFSLLAHGQTFVMLPVQSPPVRVLIKGWCFFPIYVLQSYENVVIRTYLDVSICIVSMVQCFSGSTSKVLPQEGDLCF